MEEKSYSGARPDKAGLKQSVVRRKESCSEAIL